MTMPLDGPTHIPELEGTTQIPAGLDRGFGNDFPCCSGHDRQPRRSSLGFQVHPESDGFVARAALMRDQGKQPAQILRELLDVYSEEPPVDTRLAAVEALADEFEAISAEDAGYDMGFVNGLCDAAVRLRAALHPDPSSVPA